MSSNYNFFENKKGWSLLKDKIIDNYLKPYITKLLFTRRPTYIIDCFAGKGKFDDGNIGSPIIISNHINDFIKLNNKNLFGFFIEKKYFNELKVNLDNYKNIQIYEGTFESNLKYILSLNINSNIFFYVDPYGIKNLDFDNFKKIFKKNFSSVELLLNFNSFGFIREACRLLKYSTDCDIDEDIDDYEKDDSNTKDNMNKIAYGDYWQDIIKNYKNNMYVAEEVLVEEYIKKLKQLFKFVINIPIKIKSKNIPKYRLIFGTNHEDGLILMADEMNKAWKKILENERAGQNVLFEYEFPSLVLYKGFDLDNDILEIIKNCNKIHLKKIIILLIEKYGITFSEKEYKNKIVELEKNNKIIIKRTPDITPKSGKPATSMDYKNYIIELELKY